MRAKKNKIKKYKFKFKANYVAIFVLAIFVAGIFAFGPKIRGMVEGKLIARGNYYFNGGTYDLAKAEKYFKVASFVDGKTSYPHYQLARVLFMKTDYQNARKEIDTVLSLNPDYKRAYYIRGLIDGYAKNYKAAEDDFQKFIAWAPKEWAGYNDLAWAYYQDGDYQNAAGAAQKGLDVVPGNAWLLNGLGVSLQALGKNDEAKVALDQATAIAKNLTPSDWKRAYPGNDAESAPWDLAQFKTDVNFNLQLAANPLSSGKGIFQSACASSSENTCNGTTCTLTACDSDNQVQGGTDPSSGLPYCFNFTSCNTDSDCSYGPPVPSCAPGCSYNGFSGLLIGNCVTGNGVPLPGCVGWGPGGMLGMSTCPAGQCCFRQAKSYNPYDYQDVPINTVCPTNNPPTVSIASPTILPATFDPNATNFSINVQDPDGDKITVTASTLTCPSGIQPLLGKDTSATNTTTPQNISATLGGLTAGISCTWNVTVSDGSHPVSANVVFQTQMPSPANNPPTASISNPPNGATNQSQSAIDFEASASDPDNDPLTYNSTIACNSGTLDTRSGNVFNGIISFTYGPFPSGASCIWSVSVDDGRGGTFSTSSRFKIFSCTPSPGACGSADGGQLCAGRQPTQSELCSSPDTANPSTGNFNLNSYEVDWSCPGSCGGSATSCSAKGQKTCGWIETNP